MEEEKPRMHFGARKPIFRFAEDLRNRMTPAEETLWNNVRLNQIGGIKVRRQHPVDRYILDFYCHKARLAIELDGKYHDDPFQISADEERTARLESLGIKVIRFSNEEIIQNLPEVLVPLALSNLTD